MNKGLIVFTLNRKNESQQDESLKFGVSFSNFLSCPVYYLDQCLSFLKSVPGYKNTSQHQIFYFTIVFKIIIDVQIIRLSPASCRFARRQGESAT